MNRLNGIIMALGLLVSWILFPWRLVPGRAPTVAAGETAGGFLAASYY